MSLLDGYHGPPRSRAQVDKILGGGLRRKMMASVSATTKAV